MKLNLFIILSLFFAVNIQAQQQITDLTYENITGQTIESYVEYDGQFYFSAINDGYGREIWVSDGTIANTFLLKDIYPGLENGVVYSLNEESEVLNDELYFFATDDIFGKQLWKTDGTNEGTIRITESLEAGSENVQLTAVGDNLYFLIRSGEYVLQLWKSDGTDEGTVLVKDNLSIMNGVTFQGTCNDTFIFTFQPFGSNNSKVWRSNGTEEGTFPITGEIDGNGSGLGGTAALTQYINFNDKMYFVGRYYLYETDGTLENTNIVANVWNAATNLVSFSDVIKADDKMYFLFYSADNYELAIWESNGTVSGTEEVYTIESNQYFAPSNLSAGENTLMFCSENSTGGASFYSLNLSTYLPTEIAEVSSQAIEPFIFFWMYATKIIKISEDEFFVSAAPNQSNIRKGWIVNTTNNSASHVEFLDNVWYGKIYNQNFYFSKNKQIWKYANGLSTSEFEQVASLEVFPNPSANFIFINSNSGYDNISIFDLTGKLVLDINDIENDKIDISHLKNGSYILQLKYKETIVSKKILKK